MELLPFVLVSLAVIVVPGVDMALVTRQVLVRGRASGLAAVAGAVTGGTLHATAAVLGLSAVLATSAEAFTVLKLVGGAYLLWLGLSTLWAARHATAQAPDLAPVAPSLWRSYRTGTLTNLLNPKVAVFFLTFLPQFVDPTGPVVAQTALLALVFIVLATAWLLGYALLVDRVRGVLGRPAVRRRIEQVSGGVLVLLGARLATAAR